MKSARNYTAPYTSTSFKDYLQGSTLTLATCWRLVAKSGKTVAATSHTKDLTLTAYPNIVFKSAQGVVPSAVDNEAGLGSAGLEVDGVFAVDVISEESILNGDWDAAYFEVFTINYETPAMGEYVMFAGYIGNVKTYGQRFRAEGRPLSSKATQEIGMLYTPKCTVRLLGDSRCKLVVDGSVNAADGLPIRVTGTVTTGGSNVEFSDSSKNLPTGFFDYGILEFTSGVLAGKQSEIRSFIGTGQVQNLTYVTDSSWKWSATNPAGWNTAGYSDAGWSNSYEQASIGAALWGYVANFPASTAKWIWSHYTVGTAGSGTLYFRKTFTPNVTSATITIAADNTYTLYVNGVSIGTGNNYLNAQTYTVSLNAGVTNVIAVAATNVANANPSSVNPAGLLAQVDFAPYIPPSGTAGSFRLQTPMSRIIPAGTTYVATRGCDRTWETCNNVYDNLINFRGFPFVPGVEKAYKVNR